MGFDALLKRYFPAVVCLLLGAVAYFQAAGLGQLLAGELAGAVPSAAPSASPPPPPASSAPSEHTSSANAILHRNPFDSATGPLDGKVESSEPVTQVPTSDTNPFDDPTCDSAKVLAVVVSDDPAWSFASIAGADGKSTLRRQGDEVGSQKVWFIGWTPAVQGSEGNPGSPPLATVWLTDESARCRAFLGTKIEIKKAPPAAASADAGDKKASKSKVPPEISSKIHKISDNEFNVERSALDHILENQAELMKAARVVPEKEGDKVVGIRLFGIKPDSMLTVLGLENGDRLSSINGFDMASPEKALEAYARLRTADHLTVSIQRKGKPMNIDFNIK